MPVVSRRPAKLCTPCRSSYLLRCRLLPHSTYTYVAGIPELVSLLRSRGQEVFLVSGGFRQIIHPLAQQLDIPLSHVFANNILFDVSAWCRGPPLGLGLLHSRWRCCGSCSVSSACVLVDNKAPRLAEIVSSKTAVSSPK